MLAPYSKFIAVAVGMAVLWVKQNTQWDMGGVDVQQVTDVIVMIITAISVYMVRNKQA